MRRVWTEGRSAVLPRVPSAVADARPPGRGGGISVMPVESIPVNRWEWRHMVLSEFGPPLDSHRVVLLVVEAFINDERGVAWPSQEAIARRASKGVRTVRRILALSDTAGWIHRSLFHSPGKSWRLTAYSPRVPIALKSVVEAKGWNPPAEANTVAAPSLAGEVIALAAPVAPNVRPPATDVRPFVTDDRPNEAKVRPNQADVRPSSWPTKFLSEVPIGSTKRKCKSEGAASPSPPAADSAAGTQTPDHMRSERNKARIAAGLQPKDTP